MKAILNTFLASSLVALTALHAADEQIPGDLEEKLDALVASAYQSAVAVFPCSVKTRGKPKTLRWEDVDRCLNDAAARIDWEALSSQIKDLRAGVRGPSASDFAAVVESALSIRTLPFEKVFMVKDEETLLPLTNSVLKFLPPNSLQNLRVFDKAGTLMGIFAGVYSYERTGGLATGRSYRLSLFQYTDKNGDIQAAPDKLLLDSFGVPWKDAKSQPGFRLSSDKLPPGLK